MAENSKIEWTDHTFNPWIGCSRVSPACDQCYAEAWAKRYGTAEWGPGRPRKLTSDSNWKQPLKWNHEAMTTGTRRRVFCASLADVFDNEVLEEWRLRLWNLIVLTQHLDWLLLTKRIGNVPKMLPAVWGEGWDNVWLGITVANQTEADRDIPKLMSVAAKIRFLSMEPLLGPVDLTADEEWLNGYLVNAYGDGIAGDVWERGIDWVIVGGESGRGARPLHPAWARSLRDQCNATGVPFHFKQWGEWAPSSGECGDELGYPEELNVDFSKLRNPEMLETNGCIFVKTGKKFAGRLLDGREWNEGPTMAA